MSADELRQAAETLRERAGDPAAPGPWLAVTRPGTGQAWIDVPGVDDHAFGMHGWPFEAQYIATMHPGVGLALADWLDVEAEHVASHECEAHCAYPDGGPRCLAALSLARIINGGAA